RLICAPTFRPYSAHARIVGSGLRTMLNCRLTGLVCWGYGWTCRPAHEHACTQRPHVGMTERRERADHPHLRVSGAVDVTLHSLPRAAAFRAPATGAPTMHCDWCLPGSRHINHSWRARHRRAWGPTYFRPAGASGLTSATDVHRRARGRYQRVEE